MTLKGLSDPRQRLVRLVGALSFGRIENLVVRGGEPVFEAATRVLREVKFGRTDPVSAETDDTVLKAQWVHLFRELDSIGDGKVALLQFAAGLPLLGHVEEVVIPSD